MRKKKTSRKAKLTALPKVTKSGSKARADGFPVDHYTASSMIKFSTNPILFKIEYRNGDHFETAQNVSAVLGKAFHHAMEVYYGGSDTIIVSNEADAIKGGLESGLDFIEQYPDGFIKYSEAMATKQKVKERFAFIFNEYVRFRPYKSDGEILCIEEKMEDYIDIEWRGSRLTLPVKLKGYLDKVTRRKDGRIVITDYKTTNAFSNADKIDGAKMLQAVVYYLLCYAKYGEEPYSVVYEEVKYTENKDKSPQVRPYEMVFGENELFFDFFFRFYDDMTRALNGEMVYVPNVHALFDNEVAIIAYLHRLDIDAETAKLMKKHKVDNLTDLLKKKIQSAGSMRKLLKSVEKQFVSAINLNYDKMKTEEKIKTKLLEHGLMIQFEDKVEGASVDLYRYTPSIGLKMSKIGAYAADIEQVLGVSGIRILAPIPGTSLVGFEVPRSKRRFPPLPAGLKGFEIAVGENVMGEMHRFDLRQAPHILVAGSTGSGKSVWLNGTIQQLMETPNVDLHLFDPKRVELNQYSDAVKEYQDDRKEIARSLMGLVKLMEKRYIEMKEAKAKNIQEVGRMRYKVVIIDEFADLAMGGAIGESIERLAQMGRAAGIHLILATQRASTRVINGDIKVNFPTKVVFKMAKTVDSMVMLDEAGAEKLLGKGDMLFASEAGTVRLQSYNV